MTLCDRCVHWNVCGNETCYDDDAKNALQRCADFLEVVRCKDCKYYKPQVKSAQWENKTNYCCRSAVIKVNPNDYCSYGAKMDGKGEGE